MPKEKRPDRYPVKLTMKHKGKGTSNPDKGVHYLPENAPFTIGVSGEVQLKYWLIDGKMVRENPHTVQVKKKDIVVEAVFGQKKPKELSLEIAEAAVTKDISATSGIEVEHEEAGSKKSQ